MYEVKEGDTLTKIAKSVYGDVNRYKVIFEANKPMLTDPNKIYPASTCGSRRKIEGIWGKTVVEMIGWESSLILLTLMRQGYIQWRSHAPAGVSKRLFVGLLAASTGYIVYSYFLHNWAFVSSNIAILVTALIGEFIFIRNRKAAARTKNGTPACSSTVT